VIVEIFAGGGGWSTGLRMAGYTGPAFGIEWDMVACRTAKAAGHDRICADVELYPPAAFTGQVTSLIGSPPCPTFSAAGAGAGSTDMPLVRERIAAYARGIEPPERVWTDVRSRLTAEPMRWAMALRPKWVALEQVPAVLPLWQQTAALLREHGYRVWCGILSAERYGVPQTRKRAILIASLDGPVGPPEPTHQAYRSGFDPVICDDLFGDALPPPVSMAQALGFGLADMPAPVAMTARGRQSGASDVLRGSSWRAAWWRTRQADDSWIMRSNYGTWGDPADPAGRGERMANEPAATVTGKIGRNMWLRNNTQDNSCLRGLDEPAGTIFFGQRGNAVDWVTRPATTVCGDSRIAPPGHRDREGGEPQFGVETVRATVAEAGILQSFPADYPWQGTKTQQYRCVGDCVPPLLAMAILRPLLAATRERVI
jgi:DNA (cytosine-5)-methyltransferase 1